MEKIEFINSYSFIYSSRPGTPASKLEKIDIKIAKERLHIFQKIADNIKNKYRNNLINSTAKVLFENKIKNEDKYFGRDEYFNSVIVQSDQNLIGKIRDIKLITQNRNTLFGNVITDIEKSKDYAA